MNNKICAMASTALIVLAALLSVSNSASSNSSTAIACILPHPFPQLNRSSISYIVNSEASSYSSYGCRLYEYRVNLNASNIIAVVNVSNTINETVTKNFTINYTSSDGTVKVPQYNFTYTLNFNQARQLVKCDNMEGITFFNMSLLEQLIADLINYLSGQYGACVYPLAAS